MPFQVFDPSLAVAAPVTSLGEPLVSTGETLLTIRDEVQSQMAGRDDGADDTRYNKWINWGYRHVCSMLTLKELEGSLAISITDDKDFYALPIQVAVTRTLAILDEQNYASGGIPMEKIDEKIYRELPNSDLILTLAEPVKWFRWNRMIVVWPTPSQARTAALEFKIRPDDLVDDTDSPLVPTEFHEAIILAGKYRAERSLRMSAQAKETYNDMLAMIRPIINTDGEETVEQRNRLYSPARLRDVYSGSRRRNRRNWGL